MPAECARARLSAKETQKMPRDIVQADAAHHRPLDIGNKLLDGLKRLGDRCRGPKQLRVDRKQHSRILIGGAAEHDAVDVTKMVFGLVERMNAAIDDDREIAKPPLQAMNARVIERRDVPG